MSQIDLLHYDIPDEWVNLPDGRRYKRSVMPNPSHILWGAGAVRLSDSCWLIHHGRIPNMLVEAFRANKVVWGTLPQDMLGAAEIARVAVHSIRKEVNERLSAVREAQAEEDAKLRESGAAPNSPEAKAAHKRYRARLSLITRTFDKALKRVSRAAEAFGVDTSAVGMTDAVSVAAGIKAGMERQAQAYAEAHAVIVKTRGKRDAMAKAMQGDHVFGPIAADYLDEIGGEEATAAAKKLRSVFGFDF